VIRWWNFAVAAGRCGQTNGSPVCDVSETRPCCRRRRHRAGRVANDRWVDGQSLRLGARVAQIARISDICHSRDPIWVARHTVLRYLLHYVRPTSGDLCLCRLGWCRSNNGHTTRCCLPLAFTISLPTVDSCLRRASSFFLLHSIALQLSSSSSFIRWL